jgi:hypothetical protein
MVDEVAFYRGLLSGARVAAHRNLGLGPYRTAILADGPRAYWRLGEPSGTVAFDELGAAWGSYQNGVTLSALGALTTDTNRAVSLDGVNDQVSMGDPSNGALDAGTGDFSFETWLKTTTNGEHVIASKRPSSAASPYWRITVSDDAGHVGHVRANAFDGVASIAAYGPSIRVDNGAWHHVVVVFDRDTGITIWVDAVGKTTTGSFPRSMSNNGSFVVGRSPNETFGYFQGALDEVAYYATALSSARVAAHRTAGGGGGFSPGRPEQLEAPAGWLNNGRARAKR